ncbi:hypothetical protein P3T21_006606, partial [Paraburkholderia sp. GAS334]
MNLTRSSPGAGVSSPELALQQSPRLAASQASSLFDERPFLKRLGITDWLFALAMVAGAGFALSRYSPFMN